MGKTETDVLGLLRLWQQPGRWRALANLPKSLEEHRAARSQVLADKRFALENGVGDAELSGWAAEAHAEAFGQLRRQFLALQGELSAIEEYVRQHSPEALRCLPVGFPYDAPPADGFEARAQAMRDVESRIRADTSKKNGPRNYDVQELMRLLSAAKNRGRTQAEIAREFTHETKRHWPEAKNLLRQVRRYRSRKR